MSGNAEQRVSPSTQIRRQTRPVFMTDEPQLCLYVIPLKMYIMYIIFVQDFATQKMSLI